MLTALRRQLETESRDAISLLENPAESPICSIGFDEAAVVLAWKRYASSAQLRFANEVVLQTIRARRAEKLLADDRALPTIHPDDQAWLANQWMPRALEAGLRRASRRSIPKFTSAGSPRNRCTPWRRRDWRFVGSRIRRRLARGLIGPAPVDVRRRPGRPPELTGT